MRLCKCACLHETAVRNTKPGVEKDSGYTIDLWPRWICQHECLEEAFVYMR